MPRELTRLPKTSFSGLDFNNVMTDIINLVTDNPTYNSNWSDFLSSDAGRMMTELFAYIADTLASRIDWVTNEVFIGTATQKNSAIRILKLLGYNFTLPIAAQVPITINITTNDWTNISPDGFNLTTGYTNGDTSWSPFSITAADLKGVTKTFECLSYNSTTSSYNYTSDVPIEQSGNTLLTFYEGVTTIDTFTAETDNNPIFILTGSPAIENSIAVRLIGESGQETELISVNSFLEPNAQNNEYSNGDTIPLPYILNVDEDDTVTIEFGPTSLLSSITRRLSVGQVIRVISRVGGGVDGNITKNAIPPGTSRAMFVTPISGGSPVRIVPTFVNATAGTTGANGETAEHAAVYAPLQIRTVEKTVTIEDYDITLIAHEDIITSKSYGGLNLPTDLYDLYGEYIKPLDVWNFIVTATSGYTDVEHSEYNDFRWFTYWLENMFNGIYSFSSGVFNNRVAIETADINVGDTFLDWWGDTEYTWYQFAGDSFYDGDTESGISDGDSYWFKINGDSYKTIIYTGDSTTYTSISDRMNDAILIAGDSYVVSIVGDTEKMDFRITSGDSQITLSYPMAGDTLWAALSSWGDSFGTASIEGYGDTFFNYIIIDTTTAFATAVARGMGDTSFRLKFSLGDSGGDTWGDTMQQFKNIASLIVGDSTYGDTYNSTTWRSQEDISAFYRSNVNLDSGIDMSTNYQVELSFDGDTYVTINLKEGAVDPSSVYAYEIMYNINTAFFNDEDYGDSGDTTYGDSDGLTGVATIETSGTSKYLKLTSPKTGDSSRVQIRNLGTSGYDISSTVLGSTVDGDTGDSFTCYGKIGFTVITNNNPVFGDTGAIGKIIYEVGTVNLEDTTQAVFYHYLTGDTSTIFIGDYFYNNFVNGTDIEYRPIASRIYNSYYTTSGDSVIDTTLSTFLIEMTKVPTNEMSIYSISNYWDLTQASQSYILGDTIIGDTVTIDIEFSVRINIDGKGDTTVDITDGDSSGSYSRSTLISNFNAALQASYEAEGSPYSSYSYAGMEDVFLKITSPTLTIDSSIKLVGLGDSDAAPFLLGASVSEGDSSTYNLIGDYYVEYNSTDNKMTLNKTTTTNMPDLDFYCHFINDRRSEIHSASNPIDEETYSDFLESKKIIGVNNVFKQTKFTTFDIVGTIYYSQTFTLNQVQSTLETMLYNEYSLLSSANENKRTHGVSVYKSTLLRQIESISGVEHVDITYFGKDSVLSNKYTDQANEIEARFDEIILLSEKRYYVGSLVHGPIFTYTVVEG